MGMFLRIGKLVLIIYYSTWYIVIQLITVVIVRWQSDLVNTKKKYKESLLPVCDKPYPTNKRNVQKGGDISFAELYINYHVCIASDSEKIQSFDWPKWLCALCNVISCLNPTKHHFRSCRYLHLWSCNIAGAGWQFQDRVHVHWSPGVHDVHVPRRR